MKRGTEQRAALTMPPEWAPHERTLVAWPARRETWRDTSIEAAREVHAEVVAAIAAFEPVLLVADPADADDARRRVPARDVEVVALPIDDSWLRDNGPIVVAGRDAGGAPIRRGVDFRFNAWGEAFTPYDRDAAVAARLLELLEIPRVAVDMVLEGGSIAVDGVGRLITTEQCLLNPNRNPDMSREQIEARVREALGVGQVVWLGDGLVEDADTDGHVDNICAFLGEGRALLQTVPGSDDPNHAAACDNAARLRAAGIDVVEFDLLPRTTRADGTPIAIPYTNFYLCNGAAIVPLAQLDPDMDEEALRRLGELLPGRQVVGVPGRVLALGGGGVHCITQQVPAAPL
ncbi:agmatine deiminase family protein [Conexibacter arvalis]|uniref:Agmatine deiminase n=1 Tax=Conexibacter arvalis TaxID=912552 RepID=A0A840IJN7_9ACTN|nr:agmatine deiminase family protein [Conexibacter arvalis]MBB4664160.1 agmatine deiminase [Conexibacter arvalis]